VQKNSNSYIFIFAITVSVAASVLLALASTALKPRKQIAVKLDVVKNILSVSGLSDEQIKSKKDTDILAMYEKDFATVLLDRDNRQVKREDLEKNLLTIGYKKEDLDQLYTFELISLFNKKLGIMAGKAGKSKTDFDPGYKSLFLYQPGGELKSYIIPIEGNGLWGMMYGYIALQPDLNTVTGVRFYKHQETPGLGGEAEKPWFTGQYVGKKILSDDGSFRSIDVFKGKSADVYSGDELNYYVDGISGATITSKAIANFMKEDLEKFEEYFRQIRKGGNQ